MVSGTRSKLEITTEELAQLEGWARRRSATHALVQRSRIILECANGTACRAVAAKYGMTPQTVTKWCRRFAKLRLAGLLDAARPSGPRTIDQAVIESVVLRTLKDAPPTGTHWTTRTLARHLNMSQSAISRIWRTFGIQPQRQGSFSLSADSSFNQRTRDVVGLFLDAPVKALALCVDHAGGSQLLNTAGRRPAGRQGAEDTQAVTALTACLDACVEAINASRRRGGSRDFLNFLRTLDANVPLELEIHLILDKADLEHKPSIALWLVRHRRIRVHVTPSLAAWRNEVRHWTLAIADRHGHPKTATVRQLKEALPRHLHPAAESSRPFTWIKSNDDIRLALSSHLM